MRFGNRTPIEIIDDDYYDATVPLPASYEPAADQRDDAEPAAPAPAPQRTTRRQRLASREQRGASVGATSPPATARSVARRWSGAPMPYLAAALALLAVIVLGLRSFDRHTQRPPQVGSIPKEVATTPGRAAPTAARAATRPPAAPVRHRVRSGRASRDRSSRAGQDRRPPRRPAAPSLPRPAAVDRSRSTHHGAPAGHAASPIEVEFGLGNF